MSKTGDEDEDDECFYESLDRLLSSSCSCSTSNSDSDNDSNSCSPNYGSEHVFSVPKFPAGVSNYDLWVAEPSSVSERRNRLLQEMGLSKDPSLSRVKFVSEDKESDSMEFTHLVLSDHLSRQAQRNAIILSKSDSASNHIVSQHNRLYHHVDNKFNSSSSSSSSSSVYSPSILSSHLVDGTSLSVNNRNHLIMKSQSGKDDGTSSVGIATLLNKPPLGKVCKRLDEIRSDSAVLNASSDPNRFPSHGNEGSGGEVSEDLDCNGIGKGDDQVCTIKDLDNGKEFIVNEIREDGMWNKLKEVGTGRQLTMEEFEMCVGHSPIVQELMRRQNVEEGNKDNVHSCVNGSSGGSSKLKKKGGWLKGIKSVANTMTGQKERRSSDERDTSSEKGGRRSSSATDDSQDISFHGPERVKVRQYGKSNKELTALYKSQEIQAHSGSIWTIKFSLDGKYLASAGEDRVIHVWQVLESERKGELLGDKSEDGNLNFLFLGNDSPEPTSLLLNIDNHPEKKRRGRSSLSRKSMSFEHVVVPETIFAISEKPVCSFQGHLDVVLDLSWSKSQHLLSSSMDKTVRLWNLSSKSCLKIFSHSDYVTCIQFNPVDDRYFISGSLDAKVRIWSVPDRQVVDWSDLHEMVTSACYTPDGQGALVGSYKGSCRLYNTSDNKLLPKSDINLQNKKKKSNQKKITGFQFAPGSSSEVLITSADSRIRVVDGVELVHKFKGFRNTNRQISAYLTANGKYVVSASEDSHVYIWKHEAESRPIRSKSVTDTYSYEYFHCPDVTVAVPWSGITDTWEFHNSLTGEQNEFDNNLEDVSTANHPPTPVEDVNDQDGTLPASVFANSPLHSTVSSVTNSFFFDRISATWPEEKLQSSRNRSSPQISSNILNGTNQSSSSAWGMVIVTAGLQGELRTFQNFGLPIRL